MILVLTVLLPIFVLILAGAVCGRQGWLGPGATESLNRFVVRLALPAVLFQSMAQVRRADIDHPAFVVAYGVGMLATFAVGFMCDWRGFADRGGRLSAAAIGGLAAGYANTAFMGIPLCLGVFGPAGLAPVVLATLLTVCALFALAIGLVEFDLERGRSLLRTLFRVGMALLRNPLVAAPLLGLAVNLSGIGLGGAALRVTALLGGAASPCALVTIGLFLVETTGRPAPVRAVGRLVGCKLLLQTGLTALLALLVLPMPRVWAQAAILISALPIGTGPFMLARLYGREADVAGRATLVSTVLSAGTVSALLAWIG